MSGLTKKQIDEARRRALAHIDTSATVMPGSVIGADPSLEYRIIDLTAKPGRVIAARDHIQRQGWILLDNPPPQVSGIGQAEVYAMPRDLYEETIWAAQVAKDDAARAALRGGRAAPKFL
tara:strand:- start:275 stop:634 length:360 start_codon:yes stop_codon:yes gene_type:complete